VALVDKEQLNQITTVSDQLKLAESILSEQFAEIRRSLRRLELGLLPEIRSVREQIEIYLDRVYKNEQ
jgi:signal transduction histidine kinase